MSESDTMFNERDRRCAAVQLMHSSDPSYDSQNHRWIATNNRDVPRVMKIKFPATVMVFGVISSDSHLTSSKSAWKSTPKCTWMCWRVWWSSGAIRWPVADKSKETQAWLQNECYDFVPFSHGPLLTRPERDGLLCLVIRREYHQHDLPQHQSQPDRRHPPSIRRAPAGACGKSMLPVPDPYRGGDWDWTWLHWIDVSSTTYSS